MGIFEPPAELFQRLDLRSKPADQAPEWLKAVAGLRNGNAGKYGAVTGRGRIEVGQTVFQRRA